MKRVIGLIILGFVFAAILLACDKNSSFNKIPEQTHAVSIGVLAPLSGPNAKLGQSMLRGLTIAANESNNSITLVIEDDGCDAKLALSATKKLVEIDTVTTLIGPLCTVGIVPTISYIEDQQVPQLTAGMVLQVTANAGPYHFSLLPELKHQMIAIAKYADSHNYRRISIIAVNDDLGRETAKELSLALKSNAVELVGEEYFEKTQTDFTTILRKVESSDVDAIFLMGYAGQLVSIVRDANEITVKPALLSWNLYQDKAVLALGSAAERVVYSYPEDPRNLSVKTHFAQVYKQIYGDDPDVYASNAYDSYNVLRDALLSCGDDRICIRKRIAELNSYEGANGYITVDDRGIAQRTEVSLKRVRDGVFVSIQ